MSGANYETRNAVFLAPIPFLNYINNCIIIGYMMFYNAHIQTIDTTNSVMITDIPDLCEGVMDSLC